MATAPRRASDGQSEQATRVLLIGDRFLLLDALRLALSTEKMEVAAVSNNRQSVEQASVAFNPTVVVLDASQAPTEMSTRTVRSLRDAGRVVVGMASESVSVDAAQLVSAGAGHVVGLDAGFEDLASTITKLLRGESAMGLDRQYALEQLLREHRAAEQRRWLPFRELSQRERAIFALVYDGLSADQIAEDECVSLSTVRTHIRSILTKLNVHSQLAAVAMARSNRWFSVDTLVEVG